MRGRKLNRLAGYDYSRPGAYFVTICVHDLYKRRDIFGNIHNGAMNLNTSGNAADSCWRKIPDRYRHAELDKYIIMPDHIHGIIWIHDSCRIEAGCVLNREKIAGIKQVSAAGHVDIGSEHFSDGIEHFIVGTEQCSVPTDAVSTTMIPGKRYGTLSGIIKSFKNAVTKHIRGTEQVHFAWQRSFYDRIIRSNSELHMIREYIEDNPEKWDSV